MTYKKDQNKLSEALQNLSVEIENIEMIRGLFDENDVFKLVTLMNYEDELYCEIVKNVTQKALIMGAISEITDNNSAKLGDFIYCDSSIKVGDYLTIHEKVPFYATKDAAPKLGSTFGQCLHIYADDEIYLNEKLEKVGKPLPKLELPVSSRSVRRVDSGIAVRRMQSRTVNNNEKKVFTFVKIRVRWL